MNALAFILVALASFQAGRSYSWMRQSIHGIETQAQAFKSEEEALADIEAQRAEAMAMMRKAAGLPESEEGTDS